MTTEKKNVAGWKRKAARAARVIKWSVAVGSLTSVSMLVMIREVRRDECVLGTTMPDVLRGGSPSPARYAMAGLVEALHVMAHVANGDVSVVVSERGADAVATEDLN